MKTIHIVGDSIPNGFGVGRENAFTNIVNKNIKIINSAENGANIENAYEQARRYSKCDILLVYAGINDFLMGRSLKAVLETILKISDYAKVNKIELIIGIPHDITTDATDGWCNDINYISTKNKLKDLKDIIEIASQKEKFSYIDFYSEMKQNLTEEEYNDYFFDGIHPNKEMHKKMKKILEKILYLNIL